MLAGWCKYLTEKLESGWKVSAILLASGDVQLGVIGMHGQKRSTSELNGIYRVWSQPTLSPSPYVVLSRASMSPQFCSHNAPQQRPFPGSE